MTILHALRVLDGILAISPLPGASGDLVGDLQHVADWRPSLVISLVSSAEFEAAGAVSVGGFVADHGARWEHLPIVDFGVPCAAFDARWPEVRRAALHALLGGGRVLVHCRGGCGRSGMVALRLMIEAGEAPDEALERLRSVRALRRRDRGADGLGAGGAAGSRGVSPARRLSKAKKIRLIFLATRFFARKISGLRHSLRAAGSSRGRIPPRTAIGGPVWGKMARAASGGAMPPCLATCVL